MKPQLFLLHFAGGNSYSYTFLTPFLEDQYECIPLELPGRGKRFRQPLITSKKAAIEDYCDQIKALRNKAPFVLFGHSMGAVMAYEIGFRLEAAKDGPKAVVVTGNAGPGIKREKARYNLSDENFVEELIKMGGLPSEAIENKELLNLFIPILRADFKLLENPDIPEASGLKTTPIYAVMGSEEKFAKYINNWEEYTDKGVSTQLMNGGHFFIHNHVEELAEIIRKLW